MFANMRPRVKGRFVPLNKLREFGISYNDLKWTYKGVGYETCAKAMQAREDLLGLNGEQTKKQSEPSVSTSPDSTKSSSHLVIGEQRKEGDPGLPEEEEGPDTKKRKIDPTVELKETADSKN